MKIVALLVGLVAGMLAAATMAGSLS